jgi:hypothetical protein
VTTRIYLSDSDQATALAEAIDDLGYEVAVITERFAGDDDDEAIEHVVYTPATIEQLGALIPADAFVESDEVSTP